MTRYADVQVNANSGRIAAVHVKPGDAVEVGDLLFELVDAQSEKNASRSIAASKDGVITSMNTASGAQVYRGQLLCEVADLSTLELSARSMNLNLEQHRRRRPRSPTRTTRSTAKPSPAPSPRFILSAPKSRTQPISTCASPLPAGKTLLPGMNGTVTINK